MVKSASVPAAETKTTTTDNGNAKVENKVENITAPLPIVPETKPAVAAPAQPPVVSPDEEKKLLESTWPPPLYLPGSAGMSEKYYMKHRWQSQWLWYDKKAAENKTKHQALQVLIGVGSVAVPVLLGLQEPWRDFAVWVSLIVAAAASIENVKKYGDNWRSYRRAAENLSREKSLYDVGAGPYRSTKRPFARFVERCEEVIAQQNGQFYQREEQQQTTQASGQQGQTQSYQQSETETDSGAG